MPIMTLTPTDDTYWSQLNIANNYGASSELQYNGTSTYRRDILIKFDLSVLTSSYVITNVTLKLFLVTWSNAPQLVIYRVNESWNEATYTRVAYPTIGATGNSLASLTYSMTTNTWYTSTSFNLTEFENMRNQNYGIYLCRSAESGNASYTVFSSRTGGYPPTLEITYSIKSKALQPMFIGL